MKPLIRLIVFDLDGTLVDSVEDICLSANAALEALTIPPLPHEKIRGYIGDGESTLIQRLLPPDKTDLFQKAHQLYLDYYGKHLVDTTRPYPGVVEALAKWRGEYRMAVLTNKRYSFASVMLDQLSLSRFFFAIRGGDSFPTRKPDPQGLLSIIREAGAMPDETLMVGDMRNDILTGKAAGAITCGLTYGIRPDQLIACPPDFLVDRFPDLFELIQPAT